ncbi:MAG: serpin family protein [Candidatus Edwardsbacteria bacterium]|nr:serpin family protein [Candidatus Edwardsbacteria bacterium]
MKKLFSAIAALSIIGTAITAMEIEPAALAASGNRFGFDLFHELTAKGLDKNVFVSPHSVSAALTMTWGGAKGRTARDMAKTLRFKRPTVNGIYRASESLRNSLTSDTAVTLAIANSLWLRQGLIFKPEYLNKTKKSFGAELAALDFDDPKSASVINGWVKRNTRDKIEKIVDRIGPDMALYLINAVYFKARWLHQFDPAQTRERDFFLPDGATKKQPLMRRGGEFQYLKGSDFQAVYLPYAGGRMGMYVFLPDRKNGIGDFLAKLSDSNWKQWSSQFSKRKGELALPRFKAEYEKELSLSLMKLGMKIAFMDNADFSGMAKARLAISEVRHKTFLEVNEEGTEAAAVTSVSVRMTSAMPEPPPFEMIVDHPFFIAIADRETGTILFKGAIVEPE